MTSCSTRRHRGPNKPLWETTRASGNHLRSQRPRTVAMCRAVVPGWWSTAGDESSTSQAWRKDGTQPQCLLGVEGRRHRPHQIAGQGARDHRVIVNAIAPAVIATEMNETTAPTSSPSHQPDTDEARWAARGSRNSSPGWPQIVAASPPERSMTSAAVEPPTRPSAVAPEHAGARARRSLQQHHRRVGCAHARDGRAPRPDLQSCDLSALGALAGWDSR